MPNCPPPAFLAVFLNIIFAPKYLLCYSTKGHSLGWYTVFTVFIFFISLVNGTIRHRVSADFIGSRNCVPTVFTAESPPAQGPVVLKVVPVTGAAILQVIMDQLMCASIFPHTLLV